MFVYLPVVVPFPASTSDTWSMYLHTFCLKKTGVMFFFWKDPGGEYVAFTRGEVAAEGPVESWLSRVEQAMRDALYDNAKKAVNEYPRDRDDSIRRDKWLWDYPAQVCARACAHARNNRRVEGTGCGFVFVTKDEYCRHACAETLRGFGGRKAPKAG